jgi:hypothetical protein
MPTLKPLVDYLHQIETIDAQFGDSLQPAASKEELETLATQAQELFGYTIPAAYLQLLAIADGVDFNGYTLYGSKTRQMQGEETIQLQGFVEINEFWQEYADNGDHHLLMFGETGDDLYLFDQRTQQFHVTDKVSGDVYQAFETFEELAEQFFKAALGLSDETV